MFIRDIQMFTGAARATIGYDVCATMIVGGNSPVTRVPSVHSACGASF